MSITAKSIVLDIANNWGNGFKMGVRAILFFLDGTQLTLIEGTHFAAYGSSAGATYYPKFSVNTDTSLIGNNGSNQWLGTSATNERISYVFNTPIEFDTIIIHNSHNSGSTTDQGIRSTVVTASSDAIANKVYNGTITNPTLLFSGTVAIHVSSDVEDPQIIYEAPVVYDAMRAVLDQPYAIPLDVYNAILEQIYSIADTIEVSCEQLYSMVLEVWLIQRYGDVPWLHKSLVQPFLSAPVLNKSLLQRWSGALEVEVSLEQGYSLADLLEISNEQRYGITTAVLHAVSEQIYHINERSTLFANLVQPFAIAAETAQLYVFDTKLYVNGERIPYHQIDWQSTENDYAWYCEPIVKSREIAVKFKDGAEIRIDSAGESYYLKCYGGWFLDKRFGSENYRAKGYSNSRDLSLADPLLGDIPGGMASQIVTDLAALCGITVDWQIDDGYIGDGKIVANDETPLDVIRKIVWDAKAKLRPTLDGNLIVAYEEEVAIPDWPTITPAATIVARLERISTSEQEDFQQGYNKFIVSDQLASGKIHNLVKDMIDGHTCEIHLFAAPYDPLKSYPLGHTGPSGVSIEKFGFVSELIVDELIEIIAGSGRTQHPIYGITDKSWQQANLGAVSFAEDGLLASEIKEYSLLRLSYVTKYYKWIARHPSVGDVQFVADEQEVTA